jgi:hypothetical protein
MSSLRFESPFATEWLNEPSDCRAEWDVPSLEEREE